MNPKQKRHIKKHSRLTDNSIRKNKSIMCHRLDGGIRERAALNFLLKRKGDDSLINTVYSVLCMYESFPNPIPKNCTELEKEWGKKFRENREIVDRVVHTLFQWFGTNVGWAELMLFAEVMKEWPNEPSGRLKKAMEKSRVISIVGNIPGTIS